MSRAKPRIGELGWALLDWEYSASGPLWSFVAGSLPGVRMQLDRFRRELQFVATAGQVQFWVFSTVETKLQLRSYAAGSYSTTDYDASAFPQSVSMQTAFTPREAKVHSSISGGFSHWSARFPNDITNTTTQITQSGRWFLNVWIDHTYNDRRRVNLTQPSTNALARVLVLGHHNSAAHWAEVGL